MLVASIDWQRETRWLVGLMLWALVWQALVAWRAIVPAQDAIDYLSMAQAIERQGLTTAMAEESDPMQYPIAAWLAYRGLTAIGFDTTEGWRLALPLAAGLPIVLVVPVLYLLVRRWFNTLQAVCAVALFAVLPEVARLGADGLSDGWSLLWILTAAFAVVTATAALPRIAWTAWTTAGVATALALTARSEATLLVLAMLGLPVVVRLYASRTATNAPVVRRAIAGLSLSCVGIAGVLLPYLALCGDLHPTAAMQRLLGRQGACENVPLNATAASEVTPPDAAPVDAVPPLPVATPVFGRKDYSTSSRFPNWQTALLRSGKELFSAYGYGVALLTLVGLWREGRRVALSPHGGWLMALVAMLVVAVLAVALRNGYLVARHWLLLVGLTIAFAGVGLVAVIQHVHSRLPLRAAETTWTRRGVALAVVLLATGLLAPKTLSAVHRTRIGHRHAGEWLANELAARGVSPHDVVVLDGCGWTALFSGCPTYRYELAPEAFCDAQLQYIVMPLTDVEAASARGATLRAMLQTAGHKQIEFSGPRGRPSETVVVYRWNPWLFAQRRQQTDAR